MIYNLISYVDLVEKILVPHPRPNSSRKMPKWKGIKVYNPLLLKYFLARLITIKYLHNWSAAINGCSLPIDSQMVGALQFETH